MRFAPLLLALLCVAVLFTGLDRVPRLDQREARDALVARELIQRHEPLTPLLRGDAWFEKPVAAYVGDVLTWAPGEQWTVRSRALRAGVAAVLLLLVASIGAEHFGARAGWLAAGVLATTLGLPVASRTDGAQLLATLLAWVGVSGLADATFGRRPGRDARLVVSYGALGVTLLVAGPLPALGPLGGVALYGALARRGDVMRNVRPLPGLLIAGGVALPWYAILGERYGGRFLAHVPWFPYATEPAGAWYAGAALTVSLFVVAMFPWSALLPGALLHAATWWRLPRVAGVAPAADADANGPLARERREENAAHFFIACLIAALVPIALYRSPPLPAALPALPAAALLCARLLDHVFENAQRVARVVSRAVFLLGLVGSTAAMLLALVAPRLGDAAAAPMRAIAALTLVSTWLPFLASFAGRPRLAVTLIALPVALGTPFVAYRLLPALDGYLTSAPVADVMNAEAPPLATLVTLEPPPPSLLLASRHNVVVADSLAGALVNERADDGRTYVAFRPAREHDVIDAARTPLDVLLRTPTLVLARVTIAPR